MELKNIIRIKNDYYLSKYIREHSYWYKILNRNSDMINILEEEMKEQYKMRTEDKIEDLSNKIELIKNFIDVLK